MTACSTLNINPKIDLPMCCEKLRIALNASEKCFDHLLSCEEKGQKFKIQPPKKSTETFCRIKVDGCLISNDSSQKRCDFIFRRCTNEEIYFVELKGKDVKKAFAQIKSSIEFFRPKLEFKQEQVVGFIISNRCPSGPDVQKFKKEFKEKKYGQVLEVHSSREWTHKIR